MPANCTRKAGLSSAIRSIHSPGDMLSDKPGRESARSGTPHSGALRRGSNQNVARASGTPMATSLPIPRNCRRRAGVAVWCSSSASRCMLSKALTTASSARPIVAGPWSSRKAANGANNAKPNRLRASRRVRSSEALIASIDASTAQPVSRPKRMPICQYTAASIAITNNSRTGAIKVPRQLSTPTSTAATATVAASRPGNCNSNGVNASQLVASTQARLAWLIGRAGSVMRKQGQGALAQVVVRRSLRGT